MSRTALAALMTGSWMAIGCVEAGDEHHELGALRHDFELVSEVLGARCGSLDCHGAAGRPLRLHHHHGLRLDPDDSPDGSVTRQAEHDANFLAVTGLEPEILEGVVAGERPPTDLTLVRKALGHEKHRPGTVLREDEPAARCITGWLEGRLDVELCAAASTFERPATDAPAE